MKSKQQTHDTSTADAATTTTARNTQHHSKLRERNERQDIFFGACLRQLKREGRGWTLLSHTDEYVLLNPRMHNATDPLSPKQQTGKKKMRNENSNNLVPSLNQPGSVLRWLQTHPPALPCLPLTAKQFGTKAIPPEFQDNTTLPVVLKTLSNPNREQRTAIVPEDFLTLRWQYWGSRKDHATRGPVRKSLVDLSRIPGSLLKWKAPAHRPIPQDSICPPPRTQWHESQSPILVHHYAGTTERLQYDHTVDGGTGGAAIDTTTTAADTSTTAKALLQMERLHVDTLHVAYRDTSRMTDWLEGFVRTVGLEEARRLLEGVGHVQ